MTPEILEKLFNKGPKEPDIPVNYDPDEIRAASHGIGEFIEKGQLTILRIILPILFGLGLTGLAFDHTWVSHLGATLLLLGLLTNMGINGVMLARMRSLESAGRFNDVAEIVFKAKSGYWFNRELEEDAGSASLVLALSISLIGGCFLVTWYFVMAVAILSVLLDAYVAHYVNVKGKGLVEYKKRWDELQTRRREESEAARRAHDDAVREILGDGPHLDEEEPLEANALSAEGPVYIPEDLQGKDVIEPEDADRIIPVRDPNDHSDVVKEPSIKYEDDDGTVREG